MKLNFFIEALIYLKILIFCQLNFMQSKGNKNLIKEKIEKYSQEKKSLNQVKLKLVGALLKIQKIKKLGN